ncbi:hypothetical protein LDENG_00108570, partial [Lucifuga dentata]
TSPPGNIVPGEDDFSQEIKDNHPLCIQTYALAGETLNFKVGVSREYLILKDLGIC